MSFFQILTFNENSGFILILVSLDTKHENIAPNRKTRFFYPSIKNSGKQI